MVNSVNKSPTNIQRDQKVSLWPLEQRITIMLCLSSGVTVAAGSKSDCITDESALSDTSATQKDGYAVDGGQIIHMQLAWNTYTPIDGHIYPCHTYTRWLSNTILAPISCSNIQLWLLA